MHKLVAIWRNLRGVTARSRSVYPDEWESTLHDSCRHQACSLQRHHRSQFTAMIFMYVSHPYLTSLPNVRKIQNNFLHILQELVPILVKSDAEWD